MKIAVVTPTYPPYAGGIGNVAAFNARELARLGHEVTVFTPLYRPVSADDGGISVRRLKPRFKYGNAAYLPALKHALIGYDIIHLHYPFFGGAEVIWRYRRRFKKKKAKIVVHYHMDVIGEGLIRRIFHWHRLLILPRIIKMADAIILTSLDYGRNSDIAKFMEKQPAKFAEVPNGVDTQIFQPEQKDSELSAKHDISPEDRVAIFVGGLDQAHYFKGVEHLLEAMTRLSAAPYNWKLLVVGEGNLRAGFQDLAAQLRINENTIFTGQVSDKDLPKYYNLGDVVVLPSIDKSEAFGLALVEGMACGKPAVASNLAGVRSVVTEGIDGLLASPGDAGDLAGKINYFLANPAEAASFGRAGRRKTLLKYDWKMIGIKLDDLYKKLSS